MRAAPLRICATPPKMKSVNLTGRNAIPQRFTQRNDPGHAAGTEANNNKAATPPIAQYRGSDKSGQHVRQVIAGRQ